MGHKYQPPRVNQRLAIAVAIITIAVPVISLATPAEDKGLYESACAACHGNDGAGRPQHEVGFETPLPDFSDCEFASREPDPDWYAIIHEGGPVRAFDRMMPAFGDALTEEEAYSILRHVRTFCADDNWPRGEFNLPRPIYTEKAFPEDESVLTVLRDSDSSEKLTMQFLHEKRFGPRSMWEVAVPLVSRDAISGSGTERGVGDISLGLKHALYHNLDSGTIFSVGAEVILPTGDEDEGLGKGSTIFEPFVTYGKILSNDAFFQAHAFAEFPADSALDEELGLRMTIGRTWTTGGEFGRAWSPMLEALFARDLASGADTNIDLVPQVQVALNTRQHILLNIGVRIPANNTSGRDPQYGIYVLWDWFDGGLFDGW